MHRLHTLRNGDINCLCAFYISTFCIGLVQIFRCAARDVLPLRSDRPQSHPTLAKVSRRGWRSSAMAESVGRQVSHASLEHELRSVRSAIRALREAAEIARDQSTMFQLGCAERDEKNEAQLREALANLGTDPDEGTAVHVTSHPDAGWSSSATELQHGGSWNA